MMPSPGKGIVDQNRRCPSALATHEEIVNHPELFFNTLRNFHSILGTRFLVPVIGRKELNLHLLYVEVTKRGGYDKVVNEKKWREISELLNFLATTTSASYVLKKHYLNLLYHYEQVYFFKSQGPISLTETGGPDVQDHEEYTRKRVQHSRDEGSSPLSVPAVGTIDGKFDCGYLVTVKLGSELLCGVIYHPKEPPATLDIPAEDLSMAIVPYEPRPPARLSEKRKRKKKRWGRDPSHPKPNRSGYNFFFAEKHTELKSLYPNREREFTKMIGEAWKNLGSEERMVYQNIGIKDKERYRRELKEYQEKLAANAQRH